MKEYKPGDRIGGWEVLEYRVINPNTNNASFKNRPVFAKLRCLSCGKTIKYQPIYYLLKNNSKKCSQCALVENKTNRMGVHIGDRFGKLVVIGDGGFKQKGNENHYRHCSLVQCDCGSEPFIEFDNSLKTGTKTSCGCLSSKGEYAIENFLKKNDINYAKEYSFSDLATKKTRTTKLRFDFAIFYNNNLFCLIEFDGRQHINGPDTSYWGHSTDTLESIKYRDNLKNEYCKAHNIKLIRIPYWKINKIDDILAQELKEVMPIEDEE